MLARMDPTVPPSTPVRPSTSVADDVPAWTLVGQLASLQAGHVAIWQCLALGVSRKSLRVRRDSDDWVVVHRSVLRLPGVTATHRGQLWAAVLAVAEARIGARGRAVVAPASPTALRDLAGSLAVVTGWSAAVHLGMDVAPPPRPQILVPADVTTRRDGIRLIRSRRGAVQFATRDDGLLLALPERLMWDAAHVEGGWRAAERLGDLAVFLDRTRRFSVHELLALAEEPVAFGLPRRPPRLLEVVALKADGGYSHSKTEARGRAIIREVAAEYGLRGEPRPYEVVDGDGVTRGEADVAIIDLRLDLEVDGPHHSYPSQQRRDRRRDRSMGEIAWRVRRFPVELVDGDPDEFRRQVARAIEDRVRELGLGAA